MDYELQVLRTPYLRVTVWFLGDDGDRTGLYLHIIEDGRVCNQDAYEEFLAIADTSTYGVGFEVGSNNDAATCG